MWLVAFAAVSYFGGSGAAVVPIADLHNARIQLKKSEFKSGTRIDLIF